MFSDLTKKRMSISAKLRCNKEWRKNVSERVRTKIDDKKLIKLYSSGMSQEECAIELNVTQKVIYNAMKRLGIKARKAAKRNQTGDKNTGWKGKNATKLSKHKRLYRAFGQPSKCDVCGTSDTSQSYDWANLTGDYDSPADYKRMCRSCHWKYDKKYLNFKRTRSAKKCGS